VKAGCERAQFPHPDKSLGDRGRDDASDRPMLRHGAHPECGQIHAAERQIFRTLIDFLFFSLFQSGQILRQSIAFVDFLQSTFSR
jgi:hypothetical protein